MFSLTLRDYWKCAQSHSPGLGLPMPPRTVPRLGGPLVAFADHTTPTRSDEFANQYVFLRGL